MSYDDLFGHLENDCFTLIEAAEYLEISESELYDIYVNEHIDAELMFTTRELKRYKKENLK